MVRDIVVMALFILCGIIGRTILVSGGYQPFPNFEIIMVLTFLATLVIRPTYAFLVPLGAMIGSDFLLGNSIFIGNQMNKIVLFTYTGFLMITLLSIRLKKHSTTALQSPTGKHILSIIGLGMGFVLLYDLWTNFGWWFLMYPHTAETLISVYIAGIPFMLYHILSAALTFTLIAIPLGFLLFNKESLSFDYPLKSWEHIPLVAVTILFLILSFSGAAMQLPDQSDIWLEESDATGIQITIQGSNWKITDNFCITEKDVTVYQVLEYIAQEYQLSLDSTYYEAFDSFLIESIQDDTNGDQDHYWQFYVNEDLPVVGANVFTVNNGDTILWIFEEVPSQI